MDELGSSWAGADHSGSLSSWILVDLKKKPGATQENSIKSEAEKNCVKGLNQHHFRVPPISLQVNATACAGGGERQRQ